MIEDRNLFDLWQKSLIDLLHVWSGKRPGLTQHTHGERANRNHTEPDSLGRCNSHAVSWAMESKEIYGFTN